MELEDAHGRHLLPCSLAGWIPAGTPHRNSLHRIRSVSVLLAPGMVPGAGDRVRIVRGSPLMRAMFAEAVRWPLGAAPDETGRAFFAAFACLAREWIAEEAPLTLPTATDPALRRATDHVRADPAGATLAGTCRAAGLSERTLRRRFAAALGMGWDDYRRRARLLAAIEALSGSDLPVGRIAADVGFESQSAFAKAFHQLVGLSPRAFRAGAAQRPGALPPD
jgi:AraC-like DNA-binding protein